MLAQNINDEAMISHQENVENTLSECANEEPMRFNPDVIYLKSAKNGISM